MSTCTMASGGVCARRAPTFRVSAESRTASRTSNWPNMARQYCRPFFACQRELEASPFRTTNLTTAYQGGYLSQGFAGLKSGKRWNRFGFFGKFRAGFNSYSGAIIQASQTASLTFGRRTDPSLDIGGIFEFYVSARVLLRYDFGDTIIRYNSSSVMVTGGQPIPVPGAVRNNFQFSTAVAFRF